MSERDSEGQSLVDPGADPPDATLATPDRAVRRQFVARISIVAVTLGAGVSLAFWMMLSRAPPPLPPQTAVAPAASPTGPSAPMPPLRPRLPPSEHAAQPVAPPRARPALPAPEPRAAREQPSRRGCEASDSRAEMLVCSDPALAAAEREAQRAARRAAAAGRRTDPARWLAVREAAARRSPAALAQAYRLHIAELNRLAEPPH